MDHLAGTTTFKNNYYLMRHAQSKANEAGLIVSDPVNGIKPDYALTAIGRQQAVDAAQSSRMTADTVIYCSDFSRARETAEIVSRKIGAAAPRITKALRERHFGDWELSDHANYSKVWDIDATDASHHNKNVESVDDVVERATEFIQQLEAAHQGTDILLVSHGDTLQILQTAFQKVHPSQHRSLRHLETAEIRRVN